MASSDFLLDIAPYAPIFHNLDEALSWCNSLEAYEKNLDQEDEHDLRSCWTLQTATGGFSSPYVRLDLANDLRSLQPEGLSFDEDQQTITLEGNTVEERSKYFNNALLLLSQSDKKTAFKLSKELEPIYGPRGPVLFANRKAGNRFGLPGCGVGVTLFEIDRDLNELSIFVQQRAQGKTYSRMYDNSMGGCNGCHKGAPQDPRDGVGREADEEGGAPGEVIKRFERLCVLHHSQINETEYGGKDPHTRRSSWYLNLVEINRPEDKAKGETYTPYPKDGEVECFYRLPPPAIIRGILKCRFKPSGIMALTAFLRAIGYLKREECKGLYELLKKPSWDLSPYLEDYSQEEFCPELKLTNFDFSKYESATEVCKRVWQEHAESQQQQQQ